ncbi:hypothetical protein RIF29_14067 [Crotalaria pallida]|uniref:DC1 domain-containing protein n=1 Tax=Crotalaria pallida TaxID=3830 RepID=A0AAN9FD48_CROPI
MEITEMGCPSHDHQPLKWNPPGAPYKCSGCKELGFRGSYTCENMCKYILHEECQKVVSPAFHHFFPKSDFVFYEKTPGHRTRYCDACGQDVLGFVYHCSETGFDLHPCCLLLKDSISDDGERVTLKLCQKVPSKCLKCKSKNVVDGVKGWSYVSSEGNACYHVSCFKKLILENWKRGYFSQQSNSIQMSEMESQLALPSMGLVQGGRSMRSRRIWKYTKIAVVVFKLIFSAIFGNPVSAIAALVEALVSD